MVSDRTRINHDDSTNKKEKIVWGKKVNNTLRNNEMIGTNRRVSFVELIQTLKKVQHEELNKERREMFPPGLPLGKETTPNRLGRKQRRNRKKIHKRKATQCGLEEIISTTSDFRIRDNALGEFCILFLCFILCSFQGNKKNDASSNVGTL